MPRKRTEGATQGESVARKVQNAPTVEGSGGENRKSANEGADPRIRERQKAGFGKEDGTDRNFTKKWGAENYEGLRERRGGRNFSSDGLSST